MYLPEHFAERRAPILHELIDRHPLATLITLDGGQPVADEIPFLLDAERGVLLGHVARNNPLWQRHPHETPALAVFRGPQAYVSPNWYPSKAVHGKHVPTWNYIVVQASGPLRPIEAPDALRALLERLTRRHEDGQAQPWSLSDAPADYVAQMLQAIVGIEISIDTLVGKWKCSQNRSADDRYGVVQGLRADDNASARGLAEVIESTLF